MFPGTFQLLNLSQYPKTGDHQYVRIDGFPNFPIRITKGEDTWYYYDKNRVEHKSKPNLWYAHVDQRGHSIMLNSGFQIKGFKKPEDAIKYSFREYKKFLTKKMQELNACKAAFNF